MVSNLGIVDWLALIVASVLLAAAVAAVVIGTTAVRHRRRTARLQAAAVVRRPVGGSVARSSPPKSAAPRVPLLDLPKIERLSKSDDPNTARANRAHQIRNRPEPEIRPSVLSAPGSPRIPAMAIPQGGQSAGFAMRGPGFFDDPIGRHDSRYWDGARWTEHVKEGGDRFIDPL